MPFTIYFLLYTLFFAFLYKILGLQLDDEVYLPVEINSSFFGYFIYAMRNSIGDLADPDYSLWLENKEEGTSANWLMIILCWLFWIINALLMIIVLLNFLIAVISQSYEAVVSLRNIYTYSHKADINLEYY
jgi:hypothetical protein|tara:strand:- start:112 stop:504 length:393 start_codon:yes stop_codon:yes gene_type:complete